VTQELNLSMVFLKRFSLITFFIDVMKKRRLKMYLMAIKMSGEKLYRKNLPYISMKLAIFRPEH